MSDKVSTFTGDIRGQPGYRPKTDEELKAKVDEQLKYKKMVLARAKEMRLRRDKPACAASIVSPRIKSSHVLKDGSNSIDSVKRNNAFKPAPRNNPGETPWKAAGESNDTMLNQDGHPLPNLPASQAFAELNIRIKQLVPEWTPASWETVLHNLKGNSKSPATPDWGGQSDI
jgi:hypothetical protein